MKKTLEERVEIMEKILEELTGGKKIQKRKASKPGDTFELGGVKWTVLDEVEKGFFCLADFISEGMEFNKKNNNDWKESVLREYLNGEFYEKLAAEVGEDNIITFDRNLLSLDGQTEYGTCQDDVSMLTVDEYRKYRSFIPNTEKWWWTITPDSTKCNGDSAWIRVVSPAGNINNNNYNNSNGVRPILHKQQIE